MGRSRPVNRLSLLALALCVPSPACNAVLGIDAPKEERPDTEPPTPQGSSSGVQGGEEPDEPEPPTKAEVSPYAWAAWPMPNPSAVQGAGNPQSFGKMGLEVVVDLVTRLEWQKMADEGLHTRKRAEELCAGVKVAGGNFRLPSRIELLSLIDFTQSNLYLDTDAFPEAPSGKYWSSSRFAKDSSAGWLVNFEFGTTLTSTEDEHEEHLVRCVREKGE